jgi:hypothetical protein
MSDMTTPVKQTTEGIKKAFDLKLLIMVTIVAIIVTFVVSYVVKNEVILYDNSGNVTGKGEIKPAFKLKIQKK